MSNLSSQEGKKSGLLMNFACVFYAPRSTIYIVIQWVINLVLMTAHDLFAFSRRCRCRCWEEINFTTQPNFEMLWLLPTEAYWIWLKTFHLLNGCHSWDGSSNRKCWFYGRGSAVNIYNYLDFHSIYIYIHECNKNISNFTL